MKDVGLFRISLQRHLQWSNTEEDEIPERDYKIRKSVVLDSGPKKTYSSFSHYIHSLFIIYLEAINVYF